MQFQHNCVNYGAIFALKCKFVEIWFTKVGTKCTHVYCGIHFLLPRKCLRISLLLLPDPKKMIIYARYFEKGVSQRSCLDLEIFVQFLSSLK